MYRNGIAAEVRGGGLSALEKLIKLRENEILNEPTPGEADDLLDDDKESPEPVETDGISIATSHTEDRPSTKLGTEFEGDSSDDNESVVSFEDSSEDVNALVKKSSEERKLEGDRNVKEGNWKRAIECYSTALMQRESAVLYGNRGFCYMKTEEFDKAEKDCSTAIEMDAKYKRVYKRRAAIRLGRKDYSGSARDLQDFRILTSTASDPSVMEQYKTLLPLARYVALHGYSTDDWTLHDLEESTLAKFCALLESSAVVFKSRKLWPDVVDSLSLAIIVAPKAARLYSERAQANLKLGKAALAEKDASIAIELEPSDYRYYRLRAEIKRETGDVSGAVADEKIANDLSPAGSPGTPSRPENILDSSSAVGAEQKLTSSSPSRRPASPPKRHSDSATPGPSKLENDIYLRIPVQDVYSSSVDELYDLKFSGVIKLTRKAN